MSVLRNSLAILIIVLGLINAVYVGLFFMFIGGIIQIIQSVTPVVMLSGIVIGLLKFMFSGWIGWIIAVSSIILAQIIVGLGE